MEINQFHSGTAVGDAVTNQMLMICDLLKKKGYQSHIYAQHIPEALQDRIQPITQYKGNKDNILLVHHSMGFDGFEDIVALPDKKALIYHNITPERFFDDEYIKKYIRIGLWQAAEYRNYVDYAMADSNYNRQELLSFGHKQVEVMPVHISVNRFDAIQSDPDVLQQMQGSNNILFVGRIVKNKRQEDVLRAFALYHKVFDPRGRLIFVGDTGGEYLQRLTALIRRYGLEQAVHFTGKVSEEALKAYYESAKLFLCMSEHEGFGVPLLEAMAMGVPVMAYRSSAIPETMGGAGILLLDKEPKQVAALMQTVIQDEALRTKLIQKQHERIAKLKDTGTERILTHAITAIQAGGRKRTIQLQGPFETSYSLAIVNRKLMEAMDDLKQDDISIYCTEGPGDYQPDPKNLKDKPHAKSLWEKSTSTTYPDVVIRNMYPPRVADTNGGLNFFAFGWEEDRVPSQYVAQFNHYLTGIGTMSDFVTETLKRSGLKIPVRTMGIGVELPDNFESLKPYPLKTKKSIRFLHISSAFPRKGVDLLLKAYFDRFTGDDDVCLVLKTFENPHNRVGEQLKQLQEQYSNAPEVEWINCDLPEGELYSLYKAASCYVHAARGEGFGLPVAEAMLAKVPVIVSNNTGLADFCREDTASLVPYTMEYSNSHVSDEHSRWAAPDVNILGEKMVEFFKNPTSDVISQRVERAYELISTQYTWEAVAKRWMSFIDWAQEHQKKPKVAMVTTWNNKCGIAEYTRFQCEAMADTTQFFIYPNYGVELLREDEDYVRRRTWHSAFSGDTKELTQLLKENQEEIVHIQFNFGFFSLDSLKTLIEELKDEKKIVITFHKTADADVGGKIVSLASIRDALNQCYKLVVHQDEDQETLEQFGVQPDKIQVIPHGQISYEQREQAVVSKQLDLNRSLILGSYGFLLPHKGILENIKALLEIKKNYPDVLYIVCCAMHEAQESRNYYETCQAYVKKHHLESNVVFVTDFLPLEESMVLLQACHVLLMTYLPTEESASGAVRFCVAAQRPLITSKQKIFDEFKDCTLQVEQVTPQNIAQAVSKVLSTDQSQVLKRMKEHSEATSWESVAEKFDTLYRKACME